MTHQPRPSSTDRLPTPSLWLALLLLLASGWAACSDDDDDETADAGLLDHQQLADAFSASDTQTPDQAPVFDQLVIPDAPPITCPDWHCQGADCSQLIQMPGPAAIEEATTEGYYIWGGYASFYRRWIRKDVAMLVSYAACETHRQFPDTPPLGLGDMSEENGAIPGTSKGDPDHPEGTHTDGHDMDVAYFQTDGTNELQIICGDGSDNNPNGIPGKHNDGYFCTTKENIVSWPQQVYFFSKLFESDFPYAFGIDQMLVDDLGAEVQRQHEAKLISDKAFADLNDKISWGASGGWQFHHHHIHLSFHEQ